jgi:hypothetical protein
VGEPNKPHNVIMTTALDDHYRYLGIPPVLEPVADFIDEAVLVAWDGCHKIYLALDEAEATFFAEHYEQTVRDKSDVMMAYVIRWWEDSCGLRFVSGVRHNAVDANDGFVDIVSQFADSEEEE